MCFEMRTMRANQQLSRCRTMERGLKTMGTAMLTQHTMSLSTAQGECTGNGLA